MRQRIKRQRQQLKRRREAWWWHYLPLHQQMIGGHLGPASSQSSDSAEG